MCDRHAAIPGPGRPEDGRQRRVLRLMLDAAVASASPDRAVPPHLPGSPAGRTAVVGAGKAAAAMARAVEAHWPEGRPLSGVVVTRYGHGVGPLRRIAVVEAAHPVPDGAGLPAAERILGAVRGLTEEDLVLCLASGGGSALLSKPLPGLSLADKQAVTRALLGSGAAIGGMDCVRKHLSAVKGGRLALAAARARIVTLAISDIPGDDLGAIASGPTVPDDTTQADALAVLRRYGVAVPASVLAALSDRANETPKAGQPAFRRCEARVIATSQRALLAAAEVARAAGYTPVILGDALEGEAGDALEGEARQVGRVMAGIARQAARHGQPAPPPCALLSGGETTVAVRGSGRGGRNVEFLLSLAIALSGHPGIAALAADTDGVDGCEEVAGAVISPSTLARAGEADRDARAALDDNDGHGFLSALGDQVVTGPTLTNVNDFRAILVDRPG